MWCWQISHFSRQSESTGNRYFSVFLITFLLLFGGNTSAANLTFIENFSQAVATSPTLSLRGGATLMHTDSGNVLLTGKNAWGELNVGSRISTSAGTMVIWVKPHWAANTGSHPLATLRWQDKRVSYFAISQGWWEPLGQERLYFIVNNQDFMHCSAPYQLTPNIWNMVVATWRGGENGYCKLFVNGEKLAEQVSPLKANFSPAGPLYLGSELGSTDQRNRVTNATFAETRIYNDALSDTEVYNLFVSTAAVYKLSTVIPAALQGRMSIPYRPRRDANGTLLESRVIFDEDMHWAYSPAQADAILERVRAAGFNVYVPCIYHGGGSWYPTSLVKPDPKLADRLQKNPDPLAYLIAKAHSMGIEVHPWFTVMFRGWDAYPEFYEEGTPPGAYNAHNENFRTFIVNLMLDAVKRYDVDGINLDYIRTMGICTSPGCAADYNRKTGGNLASDLAGSNVYGPARTRLEQWQDAAVRDIVFRFSTQARKIKPNLVISVDGHPKPQDVPRALEGRNEIEWANSSLVNVIFSMDYRRDVNLFNIDRVKNSLAVPDRLIPLFGNYDKPDNGPYLSRAGELTAAYVEFAQRKWPESGIAFYIYDQVSDDQITSLRAGPFKEIAKPYWPRP